MERALHGARSQVSKSTVQRVWSHNDIKPHRLETFKISNDPNFEEKFWDVSGSIWIRPSGHWCSVATEESVSSAGAHTTPPTSEEGLRTHPDP